MFELPKYIWPQFSLPATAILSATTAAPVEFFKLPKIGTLFIKLYKKGSIVYEERPFFARFQPFLYSRICDVKNLLNSTKPLICIQRQNEKHVHYKS